MSNFYCHPGKAGGTLIVLDVVGTPNDILLGGRRRERGADAAEAAAGAGDAPGQAVPFQRLQRH